MIEDYDDIGNLEAIDTILDIIVSQVIKEVSEYHDLDDDDRNFIEYNRYERANIILTDYYEKKHELLNHPLSIRSAEIVNMVYESLIHPYIKNGADLYEIQLMKEYPLQQYDSENTLFKGDVFGWYDFSDFNKRGRTKLVNVVEKLLTRNLCNRLFNFSNMDVNLYKLLANNPELIKTLDWRKFEILLARLLEKQGYVTELQRGTKDGGIDIIAIKQDKSFGENRILMQAKKYKGKVGVEPVRSLMWAQNEYKPTKSCLVTTSTFTRGAWELAERNKWQIELKDYSGLLEWIKTASTL